LFVQGVGDTYTDPQIHTINGKGFGRGNLVCVCVCLFVCVCTYVLYSIIYIT